MPHGHFLFTFPHCGRFWLTHYWSTNLLCSVELKVPSTGSTATVYSLGLEGFRVLYVCLLVFCCGLFSPFSFFFFPFLSFPPLFSSLSRPFTGESRLSKMQNKRPDPRTSSSCATLLRLLPFSCLLTFRVRLGRTRINRCGHDTTM